jgi:hypothetical protein
MQRWLTILAFVATACSAGAQPAGQPATRPEPPTTQATLVQRKPVLCPVTGKPVDFDCVTRFRGHWVYFVDNAARDQFLAKPGDYTDGLRAQLEVYLPVRVQIKCPVTGQLPDPAIYIGQGDDAVFFATPAARDAWQKDNQPYADRLKSECYTFQTTCATCGGDINPAVKRDLDGHTLYFCCAGCAAHADQDNAEALQRADRQIKDNERAFKLHQLEQARRTRSKKPTTQP